MTDATALAAARELFDAPHGTTGKVAARIAAEWGCSVGTVWRRVKPILDPWRRRKPRADAGQSALTDEETKLIGSTWFQSYRANGKRLAKLQAILDMLRANNRIEAGRVDEGTGEFIPLSASQVARLLRERGWHPDQLSQPTPKQQLASEYPNQAWQIDPSICVLYYLRDEAGLRVMEEAEFNKNKPRNLKRIEHERVWRYVIVDHCSGAVYTEYVLGAESSRNICQCFINAMQYRGPEDPFHGVPSMVMMDKGSANLGSMFTNLCAALGIATWTNAPKQPWGKGAVEKTNDLVECEFESRLRFADIRSLDALNRVRQAWQAHYNAGEVHSRHGMTRSQAWMQIGAHLIEAPDVERCMELANSKPESRVVSNLQRISFRGRTYDVSGVPGRRIGAKLLVARNAFGAEHDAQVLGHDDAGKEVWCRLGPLEFGQFGFATTATRIGEEYRSPPETDVDAHRKEAERIAMEAATDEQATAKRKAGTLPFGGTIDPFKTITDAPNVAHLPRQGTPATVRAPETREAPPMTLPANPPRHIEPLNPAVAAMAIKSRMEQLGGHWAPWCYARITERWPNGMPEEQVKPLAEELARLTRLQAVGGDA